MDQRLGPRRRLRDVTLTGGRRVARTGVRAMIVALAALTTIAIAAVHHRVCHSFGPCADSGFGRPHALYDDTGPWPAAVLALIVALQVIAHRRRHPGAVLIAVIEMLASVAVLWLVVSAHFLSQVDGDERVRLAAFGLVLLAVAQVIAEPLLAGAERTRLERGDPVIPHAIARAP
ncbi:MAG: hypothetical protein IPL61_27830 [Myxococcales bacterium]|nr:hypothetical protein [Myxococcales bacterium]